MRLGAIPACLTEPGATTIPELQAWGERAGALPDVAPIWHRFPIWDVGSRLAPVIDGIHGLGIQPMVYAETATTYRAILDGRHDEQLRELAWAARGLRLRWDQEADGDGAGFRWQQPAERALYVEAWRYVHPFMAEQGVRMLWCPVIPERALGMGLWPGREHVGALGFDRFSSTPTGRWPRAQWRASIADLMALAPDLERWVCETGRDAALIRSGAWLAEIPTVPHLTGACIFDMLIVVPPDPPIRPQEIRDDWRWKPAMYQRWALLQE